MSTIHTTPSQLALSMLEAKPNLFGAVNVRKQIKLRKSAMADAAEKFTGVLYKEYSIKGFATLKDYETAVNNAQERDGQERTFQVSERKWGRHWQGSEIVIEHKGRLYMQIRTTKNSISESTFVDSAGNEYTYEEVEPFLLAGDKRDTKKRSREATAEKQGVSVEDSVKIFDIPFDTIVSLSYAKATYEVGAEAEGAMAALVSEVEEMDAIAELEEMDFIDFDDCETP